MTSSLRLRAIYADRIAAGGLRIATGLVLASALASCSAVAGSSDAAEGDFSGFPGTQGGTEGASDDAGEDGSGEEDLPTDDLPPTDASCDPWVQDCPDGERCAWVGSDDPSLGPSAARVPRCVAIDDAPIAVGDSCQVLDGMDRCESGAQCAFPDEAGFGVCMWLCGGSPGEPECGAEAFCLPCPECPSLCLPGCDPLDSDSCHEALTCAPASNEGPFVCSLDASKPGGGGFQAACEFANECNDGLDCVDAKSVPGCDYGRCCTPYCELPSGGTNGSGADCPGETTCQPWSPSGQLDGYETLGICKLPL